MEKYRKLVPDVERVRKGNVLIVAAFDDNPISPMDKQIGTLVLNLGDCRHTDKRVEHLLYLDSIIVYNKIKKDNNVKIIIPIIKMGREHNTSYVTEIDLDNLICDFKNSYNGFLYLTVEDIKNYNKTYHNIESDDVSKILEFLPSHIEDFSKYATFQNYVIEHYLLDSYAIDKLNSGNFDLKDIYLPYLEMDESLTTSVRGFKELLEKMKTL